MTNNTNYTKIVQPTNVQEALMNDIHTKVITAFSESETLSQDKYTEKMKLITSASDMTTQEKLDAMDKNYGRRNQELWQNIATYSLISISLIGIAIGGPVAIKSVQKLVAA